MQERRRARQGEGRGVPPAPRSRHHHQFPGLGDNTGARVLAEIGDGRSRFADARALKAYAGSAPITLASGGVSPYTEVANNRLSAAGWLWAFIAATHSEQAKAHCRRRRNEGDCHAAALRSLFNRMLGQN